ncbi:hypothetical protein D7S89_00115 [Trinickia fusca]|uniref:Adhesin n=1 Tax=Trinickia fusca TaxID=2419777 RepID=A0A494XQ47_9BURK|nr:hypothetical protein D7S89_00115 [Trinickia fusca]
MRRLPQPCHVLARRLARAAVAASAVCCAWMAVSMPAAAQAVPQVNGEATIAAGAGAGIQGVATVNEAAGLDNVQSNQAAVSVGLGAGAGLNVGNDGTQLATATAHVPQASASIEQGAFANVSGAVMVNQAAGAANLQRNSVALGAGVMGVETVTDAELSAAIPKQGPMGDRATAHDARQARIDANAFTHASGIVQINQTAGAGNATANSFVLRPPAGTFF